MTSKNNISLHQIFLGLQENMRAKLSLNRRVLKHPVAKGDASELEWIDLLSTYLPTRYRVEKAFVIDHNGAISEQIDIVIFDRHYSPFLFRQNGQTYIPAESVYAVIEVKSILTKTNIQYASKKIASVRKLKRTSAYIVDRGKKCDPRPLTHIFGGILAIDGTISKRTARELFRKHENQWIDFGCSLDGNAFFVDFQNKDCCEMSKAEESLIFFFLKLLNSLQSVGTVAPMEIDKYAQKLKADQITIKN